MAEALRRDADPRREVLSGQGAFPLEDREETVAGRPGLHGRRPRNDEKPPERRLARFDQRAAEDESADVIFRRLPVQIEARRNVREGGPGTPREVIEDEPTRRMVQDPAPREAAPEEHEGAPEPGQSVEERAEDVRDHAEMAERTRRVGAEGARGHRDATAFRPTARGRGSRGLDDEEAEENERGGGRKGRLAGRGRGLAARGGDRKSREGDGEGREDRKQANRMGPPFR